MADYFISPTGNDANDGLSAATAWQTPDNIANGTITPAAGDTFSFERGGSYAFTPAAGATNYNGAALALPLGSNGTAGNPIAFRAYGAGADPIISADRDQAHHSNAFILAANFCDIEDLQFTGAASTCVNIFGDDLNFRRCTFMRGSPAAELVICTGALDVLFEDCLWSDHIGGDAMSTFNSDRMIVRRSRVEDVYPTGSGGDGWAFHASADVLVEDSCVLTTGSPDLDDIDFNCDFNVVTLTVSNASGAFASASVGDYVIFEGGSADRYNATTNPTPANNLQGQGGKIQTIVDANTAILDRAPSSIGTVPANSATGVSAILALGYGFFKAGISTAGTSTGTPRGNTTIRNTFATGGHYGPFLAWGGSDVIVENCVGVMGQNDIFDGTGPAPFNFRPRGVFAAGSDDTVGTGPSSITVRNSLGVNFGTNPAREATFATRDQGGQDVINAHNNISLQMSTGSHWFTINAAGNVGTSDNNIYHSAGGPGSARYVDFTTTLPANPPTPIDLATWSGASGSDAASIESDPIVTVTAATVSNLVGDCGPIIDSMIPAAASPAWEAGANLGANFLDDIRGIGNNNRPAPGAVCPWDVGPFQRQLDIYCDPATLPAQANGATWPTLSVRLRDEFGNDLTSASYDAVATTLVIGGLPAGTLSGTNPVSLTNGVAAFSDLSYAHALGTPELITIAFQPSDACVSTAAGKSVTVNAAVVVVTPTQLAVSSQPTSGTQGVPTATQVCIQLQDAGGVPVAQAGFPVTLTLTTGAGTSTITPSPTVNTNAAGIACFTVQHDTVEAIAFTATSPGLTDAITGNISIVTATAATGLAWNPQPPSTGTATVAMSPTPGIQLVDGTGAPVAQAGVAVTIQLVTGTGALSSFTATTGLNGLALFPSIAYDTAEAITVVGTSPLLTSTPVAAITLASAPGVSSGLVFGTNPPSAVDPNTGWPAFTVTLVDSLGATVIGDDQNVTLCVVSGATGNLIGTQTVMTVNGVATFTGIQYSAAENIQIFVKPTNPALANTPNFTVSLSGAGSGGGGGGMMMPALPYLSLLQRIATTSRIKERRRREVHEDGTSGRRGPRARRTRL